jgi:hypothetical protein
MTDAVLMIPCVGVVRATDLPCGGRCQRGAARAEAIRRCVSCGGSIDTETCLCWSAGARRPAEATR